MLDSLLESNRKIEEDWKDIENTEMELKGLLEKVTASNREEKPADMSWRDFFNKLVGKELRDLPSAFDDINMTFCQMIMNLSSYIAMFESSKNKKACVLAKKKAQAESRQHTIMKKEERLKRKVETLLEDPESAMRKSEEQKSLGYH